MGAPRWFCNVRLMRQGIMKQEFLNIKQFCHKISNKIKRFFIKKVEVYS